MLTRWRAPRLRALVVGLLATRQARAALQPVISIEHLGAGPRDLAVHVDRR